MVNYFFFLILDWVKIQIVWEWKIYRGERKYEMEGSLTILNLAKTIKNESI